MPVYCDVNGQSNIRMIRFHWFVLLNIIAPVQTMPPTTPNWAAPPVDWVSQEISFPHRISRALNFGTSSEGSVGCGLRLIYENLLNEVFAPMSDVRCACAIIIMNAVQIWQSSNRKKERKKERKEREGMELLAFAFAGIVFARCWHLHSVGRRWANGKLLI